MAQLIGGPHDGGHFSGAYGNWIAIPLGTSPDALEARYGFPVARYSWRDGAWRFDCILPASEYRDRHDLENIMYGTKARAVRSLFKFFGGKS